MSSFFSAWLQKAEDASIDGPFWSRQKPHFFSVLFCLFVCFFVFVFLFLRDVGHSGLCCLYQSVDHFSRTKRRFRKCGLTIRQQTTKNQVETCWQEICASLSLSLSLSENESHNWPAYACNSTYIPLHSRAALEQFVIAGWPVRDPVPAVARK